MPFLPVGGQAVIEGVMMRSPSRIAVAVRRTDGTIAFLEKPYASITRRFKLLGLPVLRGAVSLFETLYLGITALNFSADEAAKETVPAGAEGVAEPKKESGLGAAAQILSLVIAFGLGLLLFVVLPAKITGWLGFHDRIGFGLVDGLFRLLAFLLYLTADQPVEGDGAGPRLPRRRAQGDPCAREPRAARRRRASRASRASIRAAARRSCSWWW